MGPSKPLVATVWSNAECTSKPQVSQQYETLYVRIEKDFQESENYIIPPPYNRFQFLAINQPTPEYPDDPRDINLYETFGSQEFTEPYYKGQVVTVISSSAEVLENTAVFEFYEN